MIRPEDVHAIPPTIRESLDRYANEGCPTGGFLKAVLANDLMQAFAKADMDSMEAMPAIVGYVYNSMPSNCHGSYDIVAAWVERHKEHRLSRSDP